MKKIFDFIDSLLQESGKVGKYDQKNLILKQRYTNIEPTIYKNIPNSFVTIFLSSLCTVFAPIFAITVVIGTNIKKAGILINPILKGKFASKYDPEIKKPNAPKRAIINPIAAALPIALLIG